MVSILREVEKNKGADIGHSSEKRRRTCGFAIESSRVIGYEKEHWTVKINWKIIDVEKTQIRRSSEAKSLNLKSKEED